MLIKSLENLILSAVSARIFFIDLFVAIIIYFLPVFSHLTNFPLYLIEPMRIGVIFCLLHTNKKNALFIAITVPLFSFFVSSHPAVIKSVLIIVELLINIILFYWLVSKTNVFISMFLSIMFAKIGYYFTKYVLIQWNLMEGDLVSTPLLLQWLIAIILSFYGAVMFKRKPFTI